MDEQAQSSSFLTLTIITPETILFEGFVGGISSVNDKGPFDIIPYHENFICVIKDRIVLYDRKRKEIKKMELQTGLLEVIENKVSIYLGIETLVV